MSIRIRQKYGQGLKITLVNGSLGTEQTLIFLLKAHQSARLRKSAWQGSFKTVKLSRCSMRSSTIEKGVPTVEYARIGVAFSSQYSPVRANFGVWRGSGQ